MAPKVYHFSISAPSRAVVLAARALDIPIEIEHINLLKGEQRNESFVKINPQHVVPTLDDDGFILWESRAINCYLAEKYGKDDKLYPKDLKKRALVNQRLYFDGTNLYVKIRAICFPIIFLGETQIKKNLKDDLNNALGFLNTFLGQSKWLAGDNFTLADISTYTSMSNIMAVGWDISEYPNIKRWLEQCEIIPGYAENEEGAKLFGETVRKNLKE